jgi:hypothetical protein
MEENLQISSELTNYLLKNAKKIQEYGEITYNLIEKNFILTFNEKNEDYDSICVTCVETENGGYFYIVPIKDNIVIFNKKFNFDTFKNDNELTLAFNAIKEGRIVLLNILDKTI